MEFWPGNRFQKRLLKLNDFIAPNNFQGDSAQAQGK